MTQVNKPNPELMIYLDDVRLTLNGPAGAVNILQGMDFIAHPGEKISIVGPSGSGKTTMLMVIAGLERPTSGTVNVKGMDLAFSGLMTAAKQKLSNITQPLSERPAK